LLVTAVSTADTAWLDSAVAGSMPKPWRMICREGSASPGEPTCPASLAQCLDQLAATLAGQLLQHPASSSQQHRNATIGAAARHASTGLETAQARAVVTG
jgi:hypothetical protein